MKLVMGGVYPIRIRINEIETYSTPEISSDTFSYPILTSTGISKTFKDIQIKYFVTSVKKQYKINDGEWEDYEDKPLAVKVGDIIYAKGIDKEGIETKIASYTIPNPSGVLGVNAYDGNTSTYFSNPGALNTEYPYNIKIEDAMKGQNFRLILSTASATSGWAF